MLAPTVATNTTVLKIRQVTNGAPVVQWTGITNAWPVSLCLGTLDATGTNFTPSTTQSWYSGNDFYYTASALFPVGASTNYYAAFIPYTMPAGGTNAALPFTGTNLLTNALRLSNGTRAFLLAGPLVFASNVRYRIALEYGPNASAGSFDAWTNGDASASVGSF